MALTSEAIERCLMELARLVREDGALSKELGRSAPTFFRGDPPAPDGPGGVPEALLGARRHLEWFLVEHHRQDAAGTVAEALAEPLRAVTARLRTSDEEGTEEVADILEESHRSLLRSQTGIFEVEETRAGAGVWLRDVAGFGSFALAGEGLAERLKPGELVVGRLYPAGDGVHVASPAAAVVRGGGVAEALQRDLEEIRAASAGKVLRVSQGELEAMFFGAGDVPEVEAMAETQDPVGPRSEDPMADGVRILAEVGFTEEHARALLARLSREPRDPDQLVHGAGDVLGRILDEIAFETELDLDRARAALLRAWERISEPDENERTRPAAPAASPSTPGDPEDDAARARAIDAFAAGRAAGQDPAELISNLERELGIGAGPELDAGRPAPDFPGVVGAMIDEMKWELGATEPGFEPESLAPLEHLARFAKPIGVFEELSGSDLFRFATFWLQETRALDSDDEARALVAALRRFIDWALDAHEVDLGSEFLDALDGLEESLPRARRANDALGADVSHGIGDESAVGELYEIVELGPSAAADFESSQDRVRTRGGELMTVIVNDALRPHLVPGDRIRAEIALLGHATVHCCYPPESRALAR